MTDVRLYGFCAKCGQDKGEDTHYVCTDCRGTQGAYLYCAVCGVRFGKFTWDYVCVDDLVKPPDVSPDDVDLNFTRDTSGDQCSHNDVGSFTYGAPGYGGGSYCKRCGVTLDSHGGVLTLRDVR